MAKLLLTLDDVLLSEFHLDKPRTTIGRRPNNDIHIDNLAVSGEHAAVVKIGQDFYVEDTGSTNGTTVNGQEINKHVLQHSDVIEVGKHHLKYINEDVLSHLGTQKLDETSFEKTVMIRPAANTLTQTQAESPLTHGMQENSASVQDIVLDQTTESLLATAEQTAEKVETLAPIEQPSAPAEETTETKEANTLAVAKIQVLNGASVGRELILNKALTTLGKVGVQVAVITRRPNGYFITHVEGKVLPRVNNVPTGAQAVALSDHDIIELAGIKMEFFLS